MDLITIPFEAYVAQGWLSSDGYETKQIQAYNYNGKTARQCLEEAAERRGYFMVCSVRDLGGCINGLKGMGVRRKNGARAEIIE